MSETVSEYLEGQAPIADYARSIDALLFENRHLLTVQLEKMSRTVARHVFERLAAEGVEGELGLDVLVKLINPRKRESSVVTLQVPENPPPSPISPPSGRTLCRSTNYDPIGEAVEKAKAAMAESYEQRLGLLEAKICTLEAEVAELGKFESVLISGPLGYGVRLRAIEDHLREAHGVDLP